MRERNGGSQPDDKDKIQRLFISYMCIKRNDEPKNGRIHFLVCFDLGISSSNNLENTL